MKKNIEVTLFILTVFAVYFILDDLFFRVLRKWINQFIHQRGVSHNLNNFYNRFNYVLQKKKK